MREFGFLRVAAAVPRVHLANCRANATAILGLLAQAEAQQVDVVVFPELAVTGYSCGDLFQQQTLQRETLTALGQIVREAATAFRGLAVVGLPFVIDDRLFNTAAAFAGGKVLGLVPKSFIPNYKEFYEGRWFSAAASANTDSVMWQAERIPFGTDLLFTARELPELLVGIEICEDLWVPAPPSSAQALAGANLLLNLSASTEVIGKGSYRRQLVAGQSSRCLATYVYTSCGPGESTTDVIFGGHSLIAENGQLLAETQRFERSESLLIADTDLERLRADRLRSHRFGAALWSGSERRFRRIPFEIEHAQLTKHSLPLRRMVEAHPFVPVVRESLDERCREIFHIQVTGLSNRLDHVKNPPLTIGVSGGLDSTLALLVAVKTMDRLGRPRKRIQGFSLPGFGTTSRTQANAWRIMNQLGVTARQLDIRPLCLEQMRLIEHRPFGVDLASLGVDQFAARLRELPRLCSDLVFENVQARVRTSILMNQGFVIGTGDVSELALGWCTYNADHMSMYNPNVSVPKTLVKFLVQWAAENEFAGETRATLLDIVATEISPELLPTGQGGRTLQVTEALIGPYELHDFFLYHLVRYGSSPEKILFLASQAKFDRPYSNDEVRRCLQVFIERFFSNQFKRSCLPDGPKVGSVSLSPRGDWRMPSDAEASLWLAWAHNAGEADGESA